MSHQEVTIVIPPPETHRYFVSYWWAAGAAHGHGSLVVDLEAPVRSAEHLAALREHANGELLGAASVIHITNIVRLDTL
jgi:hypothetical protein